MQIVRKRKVAILRSLLQSIRVTHEPIKKIIIDCVRPLPKSKKGNQYIITVMCPIYYQEAFLRQG